MCFDFDGMATALGIGDGIGKISNISCLEFSLVEETGF